MNSDDDIMTGMTDPRLEAAIRLERFALVARYMAYFVLVPVFLFGAIKGNVVDLVIVTIALVAHNFFVHMVLWTRRYQLFRSPLNLVIHLMMTTLIVEFTGAEESELFVLYLFLLLGYTLYSREYIRILAVAGLLMAAYSMVVFVEWFRDGIQIAPGIIFIKLASILVCGFLVATLSELLRQAEDAAHARAQALASSEATLRTILDSTADPILVYDEDEVIMEANNKACEYLGLSRQDICGRRFRSFLFDDGTLPELFKDIKDTGAHKGEQIFVDNEGHEHNVEFHIRSYIRTGQRFFVVVAHDISEQKNLQETAHLANMRLGRLNRELRQINELKSDLLTTLSQEIRSPLTATLGYVDMLLNEELGPIVPDQRKALQSCRRCATRIFKLVDESFDVQFDTLAEYSHSTGHRSSSN